MAARPGGHRGRLIMPRSEVTLFTALSLKACQMEWSWHRPLSLERFWLFRLFFKHQKFKFQGQNTREISWSGGMSIEFQASGNLARSCKFARFVTNSDKSCNLPVFSALPRTRNALISRGEGVIPFGEIMHGYKPAPRSNFPDIN